MYVLGFSVDSAEVSKISSVNCGLHAFPKRKSFFETLTLCPTLNFSFLYLLRGLLKKIERISVLLTSLRDFPIDLLMPQFIVATN